jgi:predicted MFS family arabinose efflux permease
MLGGLVGGRVAGSPRRLSTSALVLVGVSAFALGAFLLQVGVVLSVVMAAVLMLGLRIAFTVMLTVSNDAGGLSRGTLMGVLVTGNQTGIIIGMSLSGALVAQWGYWAVGILCAAAVLGGSVFYGFIVREPAIARSHEYFSDTPLTGK